MDLSDLYQQVYEGAKKADKDYDGDGKVESGTDEYMGSRDKAIKKAMSKRKMSEANIEYLSSLYAKLIAEGFSEVEAESICFAKQEEIEESVDCPVCGCDPCQCLEGTFKIDEAKYTVTLADKKGNTKAYQNYKAGMKNKITGEPLYKADKHLAKEEMVYEIAPALAVAGKALLSRGAAMAAKAGVTRAAATSAAKNMAKDAAIDAGKSAISNVMKPKEKKEKQGPEGGLNTGGY